MMDNIREILSDDFEQASRMPLNRIKYVREEMSNRIQPWQETSFQLLNEKTARKTTARQLFTKRKNRQRCHKTTERQTPFIAEVDQNMNQSMKWTLQSEFLYQKQKKFSSLLKMKNPGHFRSNTLKSQQTFQIEQSNAKNRRVSFKQVYQTLSSIQKKNEIESRMEKKRLSSARKPVVQKISKVKKQMSICPAIIQLSQKNLQKITKNNFYKPKICKPRKAKQLTFKQINIQPNDINISFLTKKYDEVQNQINDKKERNVKDHLQKLKNNNIYIQFKIKMSNSQDSRPVIKATDMEQEQQQKVIEFVQLGLKESIKQQRQERILSRFLKTEMDKRGNGWNCVVGRNFGAHVIHQTKKYIFFQVRELTILIWKA